MPPNRFIWRAATSWPGWLGQARVVDRADAGVAERGTRRPARRCRSAAPCASRASSARAAPARRRTARRRRPSSSGGRRSRSATRPRSPGTVMPWPTTTAPPTTSRVAAAVLGRRVRDDVGAERERLLQVGRGEGVVDDEQRARLVGDLGERGDVGDAEQRVGRASRPRRSWCCRAGSRRAPASTSAIGGDGVVDAPRLGDLVEQAVGAAVGVGRARRRGRRG